MGTRTTANKFSRTSAFCQKGLTLVELVFVMALFLIIITMVTVLINPTEQIRKGHDDKRISDILLLDRVIGEFLLDNKRYPDQSNIIRKSNVLPAGSSDLSSSNPGWIYENLSSYTEKLPVDPVNDENYFYSYIHDETGYEISTKFEYYKDKMEDDNGNDDLLYEVGTNLNLISR